MLAANQANSDAQMMCQASCLGTALYMYFALTALLQGLPPVPAEEENGYPEAQQEATAALADCHAVGMLYDCVLILITLAQARVSISHADIQSKLVQTRQK